MLERFMGASGARVIRAALLAQPLVQGSGEIADRFLRVLQTEECRNGDILVNQDEDSNDFFFILSGSFVITVNGRQVAQRFAQQHVGEMAVIDPRARRSATVIAAETSVVARVPEPEFAAIACDHPQVWREIARELGERLRHRNRLVLERNEIPRVFVGSSREYLGVAERVRDQVTSERCIMRVWGDGVFGPSDISIEALEREARHSDFAVLVMGADDEVISREQHSLGVRDNVVLELGIFIGALGHDRVFMLIERGSGAKIPTDLLGVTPVTYAAGSDDELDTRLAPCCGQLRARIAELGPK